MQSVSTHRITSLNLDKAFQDLSPNESYYLQNHSVLLSVNGVKGNNTGLGKPLPANYLACDIDQPAGEVYTVGGYRSPLTKEIYSWHINSNGVHYILRTKETGCQIVYQLGCLDLSAEPKHSIENWRAFLHIEKICANRHGKYLLWTNGVGAVHYLDVEAAIETNWFSTAFFDRCPDDCALINLCVPEPCDCLKGQWIVSDPADISLNNFMLDQPFQFIYQFQYYDNRLSEWSEPSTTFYQSAKGCDITSGLSRGIRLRVPVGNPMVEKIKIAVSSGKDIWHQVEIIDKYKKYNNSQEKWYDRGLAPLTNYSDTDCSFDYDFYNDRQKIQIPTADVTRVYNPIPRDAQGIIPIKDSYGIYNYMQGNCPIDRIELDKLQININCTQSNNCIPEYATVTVRAIIFNENNLHAGFVYREGILGEPDDTAKTALFGTREHAVAQSYGQLFREKTRNFIVYVEGTGFWAEMKQWKAKDGFIANEEKGVIAIPVNPVNIPVRIHAIVTKNEGSYYYQEAKIKVPKGMRGSLRLVSHFSISGAGVNQDSSTFVRGITLLPYYRNGNNPYPITDQNKQEVSFDTCNGDVELLDAFLVRDMSVHDTGGSAYTGYLKDSDSKPIEGANIYFQSTTDLVSTTDHNGFFHFYKSGAANANVQVRLEQDCDNFNTVKTIQLPGTDGTTANQDLTITEVDFVNQFYATVIVPVKDCDGNPVSGIAVSMSGTKYKTTDLNGNATFKLRNYDDRNRIVTAWVMNPNGCFITDCADNCNPCMPSYTQQLSACFLLTPQITFPNLTINTSDLINEVNGLKAGGRYEYAAVIKGDCGRISAAYPIKFINVPKTQEKGYLGFCSFDYNGTGMILPSWGKCLKILRSSNLNDVPLQWKIDKIEKTSEGKIKLTIQSLNDYNKQFGLKTNTTYQWVQGDRVEFIYNGDGTILTTAANSGVLNYLTLSPFHDEIISGEINADANFFNQLLINDDGRLDNITEGAIIEIQRPSVATKQQIYHSMCVTIPIENGQLVYPTGTFTTFDTFLVTRNITSQTGTFAGVFEHHSPSDFWGEKISDAGRRYVDDEFENEKRFGRYLTIDSATNFSRFGDAVKRFDAQGQGDITAMWIYDDKIILAICEHDYFLAQTADELVRVGGDGIIRALPPDQRISDPQAKPYGAFGCQYDDIGSVFFGDGYAVYVDAAKNADVINDYSAAKNFAFQKAETYYRVRCRQKEAYNKTQTDPYNKYRWATGFNHSNGEVYRTLKKLRDSSYSNEYAAFQKSNDTICFHPLLDYYCGFVSFTPEYFSHIDLLDADGCAFVAFANGKPYVHPINSDKYNEFFGITCDEVVGFAINQNQEKEKIALAFEMQSDKMWFAKEVKTSYSDFISEIPPIKIKKSLGKWNGAFLFDKNSRSGLYGNSKDSVPRPTRGKYILVTMVKDNTNLLEYGSINTQKRTEYNELNLTMFKFNFAEQSGFTNNI